MKQRVIATIVFCTILAGAFALAWKNASAKDRDAERIHKQVAVMETAPNHEQFDSAENIISPPPHFDNPNVVISERAALNGILLHVRDFQHQLGMMREGKIADYNGVTDAKETIAHDVDQAWPLKLEDLGGSSNTIDSLMNINRRRLALKDVAAVRKSDCVGRYNVVELHDIAVDMAESIPFLERPKSLKESTERYYLVLAGFGIKHSEWKQIIARCMSNGT